MIYEANPPVAGPATHVLVIGVGDYPHLRKGSKKLAARNLGLGQLSSPPVTAQRFAQWWLDPLVTPGAVGYENPNCPIGSIEMLISGVGSFPVTIPGNGSAEPLRAKRDAVQDAFDAWLARVASHPDNIGVFYFCGHGVKVANHYLLVEDFGRRDNQPWENAFDVSSTILASMRKVQGSLFFMIDACKEVSLTMAQTLGANPASLLDVDLTADVKAKSTAEIYAAGEGMLAFALEGKVSRFTDALLTAMSGFCGVRTIPAPTWDADGELIATAVRKLLENGNRTAERKQTSGQRIEGDPVPLLRANKPPLVKLVLDVSPPDKRPAAIFWWKAPNGVPEEHDGANGAFSATVKRGLHTVGARPRNAEFQKVEFDDELIPPVHSVIFPVLP